MSNARSAARTSRWLLRGLGGVQLVAVLSLWVQVEGLLGTQGVLPAVDYAAMAVAGLGVDRIWRLPSLFWLWPADAMLHLLCALAAAAAGLVLCGRWVAPALLTYALAYLSLCTVGRDFLALQWDALLVEASVAALLLAPWRQPLGKTGEPDRAGLWVMRLLGVKLMLLSGYVKLASGDPSWEALTALSVHYETQPLPNPVAWWAHQLPPLLHQAATAMTLLIELVAPILVFTGRVGRLVAFLACALLLGLLFLTGNYGFFQPLSLVVLLSWLDDGWLPGSGEPPLEAGRIERCQRVGLRAAALLLLLLSALRCGLQVQGSLPAPALAVVRAVAPFRIVNGYGLFAVMTTRRPEIELQARWEEGEWHSLWLPYKPGPPDRAPPWLPLHMPRLDWQLWFAALSTCRQTAWMPGLLVALERGSPAVWGLLDAPLPEQGPPTELRALRARYTFAAPGSDDWWERGPAEMYCPPIQSSPPAPSPRGSSR